mmetsp:Transcript_39742/g.119464  ORF Transcript_39742/g.119464 Transcript_39742/m.119464 type:complete len:236 (+) Transcript_39742:1332-2039(+)
MELPRKAAVLAGPALKVSGEDILGEVEGPANDNGQAVGSPRDDVRVDRVIHDGHEYDGEVGVALLAVVRRVSLSVFLLVIASSSGTFFRSTGLLLLALRLVVRCFARHLVVVAAAMAVCGSSLSETTGPEAHSTVVVCSVRLGVGVPLLGDGSREETACLRMLLPTPPLLLPSFFFFSVNGLAPDGRRGRNGDGGGGGRTRAQPNQSARGVVFLDEGRARQSKLRGGGGGGGGWR